MRELLDRLAVSTDAAEQRATLVALARLGDVQAADAVLQFARGTPDRHLLGVALDTLGTILRDDVTGQAVPVAAILAEMLVDPAYRRIRGRIAITLFRLGLGARGALPALVEALHSGCKSSVRVPVRSAIVRISAWCLEDGDLSARRDTLAAIERVGIYYGIYVPEWFFEDVAERMNVEAEARRVLEDLRRRRAQHDAEWAKRGA